MRLIHLSADTRERGNAGGVEKFGWYLQQALGCEVAVNVPPNMNSTQTIVIGDFHHVLRLPSHIVAICFVHGLMKELAIRVGKERDFDGVIRDQHRACRRPNTEVVASSYPVAVQLERHHGIPERDTLVIPHGVDPALFPRRYPAPKPRPTVVLYAGNDYVKNVEKTKAVAALLEREHPGEYVVEYLGAKIGEEPERFARGDVYLHPSHYEGDSYACLEAAMTGLPLIVSQSGRFDLMHGDHKFGRVLTRDASVEEYAAAVRWVAATAHEYNAREWALENANFIKFAAQWRWFIDQTAHRYGIT
jgi:glycosyltransferase involved in cell wall biosynthesis